MDLFHHCRLFELLCFWEYFELRNSLQNDHLKTTDNIQSESLEAQVMCKWAYMKYNH